MDHKTEGRHDDAWKLESARDALEMGADRFMDGRCVDARDLTGNVDGCRIRRPDRAAVGARAAEAGDVAETAV